MKKILSIAVAALMMLTATDAFAQLVPGVGYVNSTLTNKVSDKKSSTDANGFYAGASYNLPVVAGLSVAPGLYYEFTSSSKAGSFAGVANGKATLAEHYLNVPVMLNYGFDLASDCRLFAFAGPTLSVGLASTTKVEAGAAGIDVEKTVDNYGSDTYGRFDCLMGFGVGFDIKSFQVKVGYDAGLLNRYTGDAKDDYKTHRSRVHLGVAFAF